ncbi:MAG: 50S ribosomal protein L25 [Ignavibacteriaceae bacterium]|nr:50S ribosomal protein L25 [Ignavibacteriaceae bacterium]
MEKKALEAQTRTRFGKSGRNILKGERKVPGVFYSTHSETISIETTENAIKPFVFTSKNYVIQLSIDGKKDIECIVKDVQFDPVTDRVIHFDLFGLTSGEKISLEIPLVFTGASAGVREGGLLQESLHKLNIECLPSNIPSVLEVDVTNLKLGKSILVSDLKYDNISILNPQDTVVVSVVVPRGVELSITSEEEISEPEVISRGKDKSEE